MVSARTSESQDRPSAARRLTFGKPTQLLRDIELNVLGDFAFGAAGGAYVLDFSNYQVIALDSTGAQVWRSGRKGSGPGEFRVPYRIAARPRGGVAVLDWGNGRVTLLSAAGKPEASLQLPFSFTQIDGLMVLPDGRFLVAAMTNHPIGDANKHSIHVFSDSLAYERSFGSVAAALDTSGVRYVGSGGFIMDRTGRVLFTPKRPYEIQRYSVEGKLIEKIPVGASLKYELGDYLAMERQGGQIRKSTTAKTQFVEIPIPVTELPEGGFLGGRGTFETTTIDLISRTGVLEASARNPAGCVQILGVDAERRQVYCKALRDDVPVLLRVPFFISSG
jgi:hypothetical protein